MAIGALIGGMIGRAGLRSQEAAERTRQEEQLRNQTLGNLALRDLERNWDNLDQAGREARYSLIEQAHKFKPGALAGLAGLGEQFYYNVLPPMMQRGQAQPVQQGPARTSEAQLPTPAETLTPSIMTPPTLPKPQKIELSQIPAERTAQQKRIVANQTRAEALQRIELSNLPEEWKEIGRAEIMGIKGIPAYETQMAGIEQRRAAAEAKTGEAKAVRMVLRDGVQVPVYRSGDREYFPTPEGGLQEYIPQTGDRQIPKEVPPAIVYGPKDVHLVNRDINDPQVKSLGIGAKTAAAGRGGASGAQQSRAFRDTMALRKEFEAHPIVKSHNEISRQMKTAQSAMAEVQAQTKSGQSPNYVVVDQALINIFNKMIDPNSVVREGEYARTIENTPLLNRIKGKAYSVASGGAGLSPDERKAITAMAQRFYQDSNATYTQWAGQYQRLAGEAGMPASSVVLPRESTTGQGGADSDYGPVQDAVYKGQKVKVRKNLKTGKFKRMD